MLLTSCMQTAKYICKRKLKMISVYCMLSETYLVFADVNAFNQCVATKFCLLSVMFLNIRSSFSEGRYMEEVLLRLTFLEWY